MMIFIFLKSDTISMYSDKNSNMDVLKMLKDI